MPGPMLYETPPDRFDGHQHQVELDESGDGLTSEDGPYPHAHEVQGGVVQVQRMPNYVSDHPGDLVPIEGAQEEMPNDQMMPPEQMQGGQAAPMGPGGQMGPQMAPMGEGVYDDEVTAILYEDADPLILAERLLFS